MFQSAPEHRAVFVDAGGVRPLIALINDSDNEATAESAAGATAFLCRFSAPIAERVVADGALEALVALLQRQSVGGRKMEYAVWALAFMLPLITWQHRPENRALALGSVRPLAECLSRSSSLGDTVLAIRSVTALHYLFDSDPAADEPARRSSAALAGRLFEACGPVPAVPASFRQSAGIDLCDGENL